MPVDEAKVTQFATQWAGAQPSVFAFICASVTNFDDAEGEDAPSRRSDQVRVIVDDSLPAVEVPVVHGGTNAR